MRKLMIILAIAVVWIVTPTRGWAQSEIVLDELRIMIWPEYDQPSVLVFYVGQASAGAGPATELAFNLPDGATLNAAAYMDASSSNLLLADATQDGSRLDFASPNGAFHIEYYDPSLSFSDNQRTYTLSFTSEYTVNRLLVEFQHPVGATDIVTTPANGVLSTDQVGLQATIVEVGAVSAGSPVDISMSYSKDSAVLSAQAINPGISDAPVAEPVAQPAAASSGSTLLYVAIGVGVLVLATAGVYFWQTRQRSTPTSRRQKSTPRAGSSGARFCTQCGSEVGHDDRFCRNCGNAL